MSKTDFIFFFLILIVKFRVKKRPRRLGFSQRKNNIDCHSLAKTKYLNICFIFYIHILTYLFLDNFMYLFIYVIAYSPSTGHDKKKS